MPLLASVRSPLTPPEYRALARLAEALSVVAVVHLAGGLIPVGDDVLYNASPGWDLLRYDHLAHALAVFCGTQLVWELMVRSATGPTDRGRLVLVCCLAGVGLGAVNETIEFLTTMARGGSHAGGYINTGWDLVTNLAAAFAAAFALHRRQTAGDPAPR